MVAIGAANPREALLKVPTFQVLPDYMRNYRTEISLPDGQDRITISISDNGPGVEEKNRERVFEPLFTSRPDGTGLGLAIVRQTVEEHQGSISVDTGKRGGARFTILLPLPA